MKKYSKPQIIAKNLPSGSYAAGCPTHDNSTWNCPFFNGKNKMCKKCEISA